MLNNISKVLWVAQVFLTFFPAWFMYSQFQRARRSGYRDQSALPFAAALFTWTIAAMMNSFTAFSGHIPYAKSESAIHGVLDIVRILFSTINTLFLTIGAARLDNFPTRFRGDLLRTLSNRKWVVIGLGLLAIEVFAAAIFGGWKRVQLLDALYGFAGAILIAIGLYKSFRKYELGKILTFAIIAALVLLEVILIYLAFFWEPQSDPEAIYLTSILVTSKVAFMIVLVMVSAAWGQYYMSETIEEVKQGQEPQKIRFLLEVVHSIDNEYARRNAYDTILLYWPNSPALLESILVEGPSGKVIVVSNNLQMIADLVDAGVLNISLSPVGYSITTELMRASERLKEHSNGQIRNPAG